MHHFDGFGLQVVMKHIEPGVCPFLAVACPESLSWAVMPAKAKSGAFHAGGAAGHNPCFGCYPMQRCALGLILEAGIDTLDQPERPPDGFIS